MNNLTVTKAGTVDAVPADLNDRLVWLTRFGKPTLYFGEYQWSAWCDMHVSDTVQGASFKVKTEAKHTNPDSAITQLIERVLATLAQLK